MLQCNKDNHAGCHDMQCEELGPISAPTHVSIINNQVQISVLLGHLDLESGPYALDCVRLCKHNQRSRQSFNIQYSIFTPCSQSAAMVRLSLHWNIEFDIEGVDVEDINQYTPGGFHPIRLGDVLSSTKAQYRVLHKLGRGAFSTVWLAEALQEPT
jgi:hypothetical protein